MAWIHYSKIPMYLIFYLFKGDCKLLNAARSMSTPAPNLKPCGESLDSLLNARDSNPLGLVVPREVFLRIRIMVCWSI